MTRCPMCDAGWPVKRWYREDGTGSWRMHQRGSVTFDNFESHFCRKNSWVSRHRLVTAFIGVYVLLAVWMLPVLL